MGLIYEKKASKNPIGNQIHNNIVGVVSGAFGIIISVIIGYLGYRIESRQSQFMQEMESRKIEFVERQERIGSSQLAASVISNLSGGDRNEKLLALKLLEGVGDLQSIDAFLDEYHDMESDTVLKKATKELKANLKNREERNRALSSAGIFLENGNLKSAAKYYNKAAKYIDSGKVDLSKLNSAQTLYEKGSYQKAIEQYREIFEEHEKQ